MGSTSSTRLHTTILRSSRKSDGTFDVIDSNWRYDQKVLRHNFNPYKWASGSIIKIWRFGSSGSSGWSGLGGYAYYGSDRLAGGETLYPGQYLLSGNAQFALVFQGDGNLVLRNNGKALWASDTNGTGANRLVMQGDGNLVLYAGGTAKWASGTNGKESSYAVLQTDGNFVTYEDGGSATWSSRTSGHPTFTYYGSDRLHSGEVLRTGYYLRSSDKCYALLMQGDGNLVLYGPGYHVLWSSGTTGTGADRVAMQGDGNLVVYTSSGKAVWSSRTGGNGASYIVAQTDGNLVVYRNGGGHTWASGTNGKV